ncbi:MAG: GTPase [Candidatus Diapherotrites archaeon]
MSFRKRVGQVIEKSDIIIEILDVRFPVICRNIGLEKKILEAGKKLVFVLNKSDLVSKNQSERIKKRFAENERVVFVSARTKAGIGMLRRTIKEISKGEKVTVGIIGYPNNGKSSVINALRGKKVTKTSIKAGLTRGEQLIKLDKNVMLIDTPGVIPFDVRDEAKLVMMCAKSAERISDVEGAALGVLEMLIENYPEALEKRYGVELSDEAYDMLEKIALKKKKLIGKGEPDLHNTAKIIILDWQKGKIK